MSEIENMKQNKGGHTSSSWFLKRKVESVITCQPSPGGVLARIIKNTLNSDPSKAMIMITEDRDLSVIFLLKKTDHSEIMSASIKTGMVL